VIPGTIGGSIINNASFQDETISSSLIKIKVLDEKGNIYYIPSSNIQFSFHQSSLKKQNLLIIEGEFMPLREEFENIKKQRIDALNYKIKSHPSYLDNLGSIFQNAYSQKVWKLIQSLNLHSYQLGQTRLSPLHYNFFDAYQESKVENVYYLIEEIRLLLYNKLGYDIDIEIEVLSAHGKK
jgi:UDP-N-acetylenolpyruvoylglucosamine reductase